MQAIANWQPQSGQSDLNLLTENRSLATSYKTRAFILAQQNEPSHLDRVYYPQTISPSTTFADLSTTHPRPTNRFVGRG